MPTFIVMGTCGEYSNRTVWPSCIVEDEAEARVLVQKLHSETRALLMA
jgi:hypothetical protein